MLHILAILEMLFTSTEKAFCVFEYTRTQLSKTAQCGFVKKIQNKVLATAHNRKWQKSLLRNNFWVGRVKRS